MYGRLSLSLRETKAGTHHTDSNLKIVSWASLLFKVAWSFLPLGISQPLSNFYSLMPACCLAVYTHFPSIPSHISSLFPLAYHPGNSRFPVEEFCVLAKPHCMRGAEEHGKGQGDTFFPQRGLGGSFLIKIFSNSLPWLKEAQPGPETLPGFSR